MRTRLALSSLAALIGISCAAGTATAQVPPSPVSEGGYLAFELVPETTVRFVSIVGETRGPAVEPIGADAVFPFVFRDLSVDRSTSAGQVYHKATFDIDWVGGQPAGWSVILPDSINQVVSGQTVSRQLTIQHAASVNLRLAALNLTANMTYLAGPPDYLTFTQTFYAIVYPTPGLVASILYAAPEGAPLVAPPNTWVTIPLEVTNGDLYLQDVETRVFIAATDAVKPEQIPIVAPGPTIVNPLETKVFRVQFRTPKGETYYGSESLQYTIVVTNLERESVSSSTSGVLLVQGFYFSVPLLVGTPLLLVLVVMIVLAIISGRGYYDRSYLGKPIPPWRIPAEAARLNRLRQEDPRRFYLERYFLMEEEHQSALNWFHSYRSRSKEQVQQEAKSLKLEEKAGSLVHPSLKRFDHRAERLRWKYHRRQERARLKVDARIEKLENKLEKHYQEDFDEDHEQWKKQVEKIQKRANKPWFKEHKNWEREVDRILEEWEKPFADDKAKHDKATAKARSEHESRVKKEDRQAWKDWKEAAENAKTENELRRKEGREPIPLPELVSQAVGFAKLPPAFKEPPKPRLPSEPIAPKIPLPPEPKPEKPKMEASHYARKGRRLGKKAERKTRRLQRKLNRLLARNERHRVSAIAKADLKRNRLLRKSRRVLQPSPLQRLLHLTPEAKERRAHRKLLKAQARERLRAVEEQERTRLEVSEVEAKRGEAELSAQLTRNRAEVRKPTGTAKMQVDSDAVGRGKEELEALRAANTERIAKDRAAALARVAAEKERIQKELDLQLSEQRAQKRQPKAGHEAPAPRPARTAKSSRK